jgi:5-methylcytosine-specific restriction protein A
VFAEQAFVEPLFVRRLIDVYPVPFVPSACRERGCPEPAGPRGWCEGHDPGAWAGARPMPSGWTGRRALVLERDHHTCVLCGAPATEVDHVVPRAEGGTDELTNLRSLCEPCHKAETAKLLRRHGASRQAPH